MCLLALPFFFIQFANALFAGLMTIHANPQAPSAIAYRSPPAPITTIAFGTQAAAAFMPAAWAASKISDGDLFIGVFLWGFLATGASSHDVMTLSTRQEKYISR